MINLKQAAKYYDGLPHQDKAWEYLQLSIDEEILEGFAKIYRSHGVGGASSVQTPLDRVINRIKELGFNLEKGKAYIVGLEGLGTDFKPNSDELDIWNDCILLINVEKSGRVTTVGPFKATTEPGRYYTDNPMSPKGSARVLTDSFNKDIWARGTHIRQPNCLVQSAAPITVTRDSNKDGKRGSTEIKESGFFGINFHHTGSDVPPVTIGRWSAGCSVVAKKSEHQRIMAALPATQKVFSYILLDGSKI